MKQRVNISIDEELIERLRAEKDYSKVINELLRRHYQVERSENIEFLSEILADLKKKSKETRKKVKEVSSKIKKIKQEESKFLEKFQSKGKLVEQIIKKREQINKSGYRRVEFLITPEEEADKILKGGAMITR